MISAFDFEAFTIVETSGDIEDHGVVEKVGAGEAEAVVTVGLGEVCGRLLRKALNSVEEKWRT